jgi:rhamnosyltransferase
MKKNDQFVCSVVIPTKNGGPLFERVLRGLQSQTCWADVQLVVVDSGSNDGTPELARQYGALVHEIPPQQFNHGATRDLGISLAASENIVLLVQDAVPYNPHLLENLVTALMEPGTAAAYARQIPQASADILTKRNLNGWLTGRLLREVRMLKSVADYENLPPLSKYYFCNFDNVCSAIRKSVWQTMKFGNIDFGEDIDWAERALKAGHTIIYEPEAAVVHSHERPLEYEYKRTYVCHRKLFRQFGLRTVPSLRPALFAWVRASGRDIMYVMQHEKRLASKLKMAFKVPVLNLLSVIGQYRAARDELSGIERKIQGV